MSTLRPMKHQPRFAPYQNPTKRQRQTARNHSRFPLLLHVRRPVRLLELRASYAQPGRAIDICCSLESYDLDYCPPYRALSYTWDNPFLEDDDSSGVRDWSSPRRPIFLNGRYVLVRQNLYDALHELVRRHWSGFYWIDYMCIDQHNLEERTAQVATMGEIFSGAFEVVCWLGRADSHLENVLELHHRLQLSTANFGFKVVAALAPTTFDQILCTDTPGPTIFDDNFRPTEALCSSYVVFERRKWFGRLWVAQEVALAKSLVALCGERLLEWSAMRDVAEHALPASKSISWGAYYNLQKKTHHIPGRGMRYMGRLRDSHCRSVPGTNLQGLHKKMPEQEKHALLLDTLEDTCNLQASDPRDKIYGILGIVSRVQPHISGPRITVDYTTSVVKLFIQVVTALIMGLPYLSILIGTHHSAPSPRHDLPSWVPNFNCTGSSRQRMGCPGDSAGVEFRGLSQAIRAVKGNQLILAGHMLDTISRIWHTSTSIDHTWHVTDILGLCSLSTSSRWQTNHIESYFSIMFRSENPRWKHLTEHEAALFRAHVLSTLAECAKRGNRDQISTLKVSLERLRRTSCGKSVPC